MREILRREFLTDEYLGSAFVAWNANRFDVFFIAAALVADDDLIMYPYMTKSKTIRGLRILKRSEMNEKRPKAWEFLDGIAMTGLTALSLDKFVSNFAPDFPKMKGTIDFENEDFNPNNHLHKQYAARDSEGLYHAITHAQDILLEHFERDLSVTMGGAGIRIFQDHIPEQITISPLTDALHQAITEFAMRGGYCYCVRRYEGPVWKYDINQAYAAAMRETALPCGETMKVNFIPTRDCPFVAYVKVAKQPKGKIPFYFKTTNGARTIAKFSATEISNTWLTSQEIRQLQSEGWHVEIGECYAWANHFTMKDYINRLEKIRMTCEGGPSGPIGTMVKAVGNHSYGKTVEIVSHQQFVISEDCPEGFVEYYDPLQPDPIEHVFWRFDEDRKPKDYHKPQIGAFITAHVRMVLRRAILQSPDTWLYADTDCVVFSSDVTPKLDIHAKRYGAWKIEEEGTIYQIIAKKVYRSLDDKKRSAKGLNVKRLSSDHFQQWYEGEPPTQDQTQLNNFIRVMRGSEMYRKQTRKGTNVN